MAEYSYPVMQTAAALNDAGERRNLEAFLDYYRDVMVHKLRGGALD